MAPPTSYGKPQDINTPLTRSAVFLVCKINRTPQAIPKIRSTLAGLSSLAKNVASRDQRKANFAITVAIGADAWDVIVASTRPNELRPLPVIQGNTHATVSTPGDLLFHIRADRSDLCFEFERQLLDNLGESVIVEDETVGFRYFDTRDLLGFVDGTANPVKAEVPDVVFATAEDDSGAIGGSYVVVQKYLHDLKGWKKLSTEQQEAVVGRTKMDNMELDVAGSDQQKAHKTLATIEGENGEEYDILRDNMPFGSPGAGEYGTYFIGYSKRLWVIEQMLERMFIGDPPGLHDRILDYSIPTTGTTFFAPSADVLAGLA